MPWVPRKASHVKFIRASDSENLFTRAFVKMSGRGSSVMIGHAELSFRCQSIFDGHHDLVGGHRGAVMP